MSAFGGKADIARYALVGADFGIKAKCRQAVLMSLFEKANLLESSSRWINLRSITN